MFEVEVFRIPVGGIIRSGGQRVSHPVTPPNPETVRQCDDPGRPQYYDVGRFTYTPLTTDPESLHLYILKNLGSRPTSDHKQGKNFTTVHRRRTQDIPLTLGHT